MVVAATLTDFSGLPLKEIVLTLKFGITSCPHSISPWYCNSVTVTTVLQSVFIGDMHVNAYIKGSELHNLQLTPCSCAGMNDCPEHLKYVAVVFDEMHVRADFFPLYRIL